MGISRKVPLGIPTKQKSLVAFVDLEMAHKSRAHDLIGSVIFIYQIQIITCSNPMSKFAPQGSISRAQ